MHPPNPAHLVVCFHPFGYTLPLCRFVHEPGDFESLRRYAKWHYDRGVERAGAGEIPKWWNGPFFCGWKEQAVTPGVENPKDAASQENYQRMSDTLDERLLRPSAVIIDDKWQKAYGTALPDPDKWPDMRAFVEGQHQKGRRVVLWFKSWDAEGLQDDECILSATEKYEEAACDYCGEHHDGTLWGRLIAFIHMILAFFRQLFTR